MKNTNIIVVINQYCGYMVDWNKHFLIPTIICFCGSNQNGAYVTVQELKREKPFKGQMRLWLIDSLDKWASSLRSFWLLLVYKVSDVCSSLPVSATLAYLYIQEPNIITSFHPQTTPLRTKRMESVEPALSFVVFDVFHCYKSNYYIAPCCVGWASISSLSCPGLWTRDWVI